MPTALNQSALGAPSTGQTIIIDNTVPCSPAQLCESGYANANSVTMSYGDYQFAPVPFMTLNKIFNKTPDGLSVGTTFNLTLQGTVALVTMGGITNTMVEHRRIRDAFDEDGKYFVVKCDDTVVFECYPRVISLNFDTSPDNWVFSIPYTINLEMENEPVGNISPWASGENISGLMPPFIKDYQESWQIEFLEETAKYNMNTVAGLDENPYALRVSHNVSAVGVRHYAGTGQLIGTLDSPAWQQARTYVQSKLGFNPVIAASESCFNLPTGIWAAYDHARVNSVGITDGSYSVNETWIALSQNITNPRAAIEDFTVDVTNNLQDDFATVAIQGSIRGLQSIDYGTTSGSFSLNQSKYNAASGYWAELKSDNLLYGRAANVAAQENLTLNAEPQIRIIGHSPNQGTITYNYGYDTRPSNCIEGARFENITITDNNPVDVFASIRVLGRSQGPILQNMNTVTEFSRSVNIEILMSGNQGCTYLNFISGNNPNNEVNENILCPIYNGLTATYSTVLKSEDTVSWSPKTGRYNRTVTWSAVDCTTSPNTSGFC